MVPPTHLAGPLLATLATLAPSAASGAGRTPREAVAAWVQSYGEALGRQGTARDEALLRLVHDTHDLEGAAAALLGAPGLDAAARAPVEEALSLWCAAGYGAWAEESGALAPPRILEETDEAARVATSLGPDGTELVLSLVRRDAGWRVADLAVDGEGVLDSLRAELAPVLDPPDPAAVAAWLRADAAALAATPVEVVAGLQAAILGVMKEADALGYEGRFERLAPVIARTHDLPAIAKLTARGFWDELGDAQRERYTELFSRLIVSTYAARFDGWSGERFEQAGEREIRGGVVVDTNLVKRSGERIVFEYLLRRARGRWRILNIVVDGVSDLAVRRSEYASVFGDQGFDGLLAKLEERIAGYEAGETD